MQPTPLDGTKGKPRADAPLSITRWKTGLNASFKTALLQRLANPLAPYDPALNPYITVDWQPIDLLVFNGEEKPQPNTDPDEPNAGLFDAAATPTYFPSASTRERPSTISPDGFNNLWRIISSTLTEPNPVTMTPPPDYTPTTSNQNGSGDVFQYTLNQSLGHLNASLGKTWASGQPASTPTNYGYTNAPDPTATPNYPFPWLTWNNRPFANAAELTLVPATSAEQLLRSFTSVVSGTDRYNPDVTIPGAKPPFSHLLNFWATSNNPTSGGTKAPYFYRLFDLVHVPSRFVGTDTYLNPSIFRNMLPDGPTEASLASYYHPPFNKVSNYREPGRININTIPTDPKPPIQPSQIWSGVINGQTLNGHPFPAWGTIVASRRGYAGNTATTTTTLPSYFANPFRGAGGASLLLPGVASAAIPETETTFLRRDPSNNTLFSKYTAASSGVFGSGPTYEQFSDGTRNAYFNNQPLIRTNGILTTRSNVYAVWVTIGYFEVSPAPMTGSPAAIDYTIYPDGYQLGQELGADTGEITRHRAFYIYDRSLPVCFEPGVDHNFDKGILLKRYIE